MARVLGESGRFVSQVATKRFQATWRDGVIAVAVAGLICGFVVRSSLPWLTLTPTSGSLLSSALGLLMWLVASLTFRRMDALDREREHWGKGAVGEKSVAHTLSKLPDEFRVVNDLPTPSGNLDHVVIGPTGVFVIETKNWRGIVGADGKGELTCNGKVQKPYVKRLVGRMMGTKERVAVLAPGVDPFFKAVFVFTSAWVEARFGSTGWADCVTDERLFKYIVDSKPGKRLSPGEVDAVARAFSSLARMDPDFNARAEVEADDKKATADVCALVEPARA
jgi:hypothetical protein